MQNTPKQNLGHGLRVLLADKSEVCQQLRQKLEKLPFIDIVAETNTDRQTLDHVFELTPAVVVLSAQLPEMGGFEVLRFIKRVVPNCVVILTSNHVTKFVEETATLLGAHAFCTIGDGISELRAVLQKEMDGRIGGHL